MPLKLITEKREIVAAISEIKRKGTELDDHIHLVAVSCLAHAEKHGDVTLATQLVRAMPRSGRKQALVYWFGQHGPLSWNREKDQFNITKGKEKAPFNVAGGEENPFYDFTVEKDPAPFTVDKLVGYVMRKVKQAKEKGQLKDGDMQKLKDQIGQLEA